MREEWKERIGKKNHIECYFKNVAAGLKKKLELLRRKKKSFAATDSAGFSSKYTTSNRNKNIRHTYSPSYSFTYVYCTVLYCTVL